MKVWDSGLKRSVALACAAALISFGGCKKKAPPPIAEPALAGAPEAAAPGSAKSGGGDSDGDEPHDAPVGSLDPIIREMAAPGAIARAVEIELARPVSASGGGDKVRVRDGDDDSSGDESSGGDDTSGGDGSDSEESASSDDSAGKESVVHVTPKIAGTLSWKTHATLRFTPGQSFAADTRYTFVVDRIATKTGLVTAPAGSKWSRSFTTPKFAFQRVDVTRRDVKALDLIVAFTGPVNHAGIESRMHFTVNGNAPKRADVSGSDFNLVRVRLTTDEYLTDPVKVVYTQDAGIRGALPGDPVAAAATRSFSTTEGKTVSIMAAYVAEAARGHYVQVVCNDEAAGSSSGYYDNGARRYFNVSARCLLSPDAIQFQPPVKKITLAQTRGGFRIFGNFTRGGYTIRINSGARSADGGVVRRSFTEELDVHSRKQQVQFIAEGRYLPKSAWKSLAIRHVNTDKIDLVVRRIPLENLPFWLSEGSSEAATERNSDVLAKRELALGGALDAQALGFIHLDRIVPDLTHGVFELTASVESAKDTRRLLFTDINLIAKREEATNKVHVHAIDINDLAPLSGVSVKQIVKSGRVAASCTTNGRGGCVLPAPDASFPDKSEPFALIATKGSDTTYLRYSDLKTDLTESEVGGDPYDDPRPYRATLYGDRGVYRPGETAHVSTIVRDKDSVAPREGMPLSAELFDPRGKVTRRLSAKTGPSGMASWDIRFSDNADTGKYRLELSAGKKKLGEIAWNVEEFVPERMKVSARAAKGGYLMSDQPGVEIEARYLFGGSAAGTPYQLDCALKPAEFSPPGQSRYSFGVFPSDDKVQKPIALDAEKGELDDKGKASAACSALGKRPEFAGAAKMVARVAVMEAGSGRSTQAEVSIPVHPERYYLGLATGEKSLAAGRTFTVQGVVVDWDGKLSQAIREVTIELLHLETEYDWGYDDGDGSRYRRYERPISDGEVKASVTGGAFTAQLTPGSDASGWLVRARAGHAMSDLKLSGGGSGYYGWWQSAPGAGETTAKPLRPTALAVETDAPVKLRVKNKLRFIAPFKGRALVTVETDKILSESWLDVAAGPVEWTFEIDQFVPNVYLSALVIKDPSAGVEKAFLPDRAFGVKSVAVDAAPFTQTLALAAPAEVRSGARLEIDVDVGTDAGPTAITVAAVDQGILQLTHFAPPDPLAALLERRKLGIETFETVGWNVSLPAATRAPGGGDDEGGEGGDAAGRINPIKPVALFSGLVDVPAGGKTKVVFNLPPYRGALTIMAVAASARRIGHATAQVLVRDPLVVETTMPRFLLQNDVAEVPVFVTNMSGHEQSIVVRVASSSLREVGVPGMSLAAEKREDDAFLAEAPLAIVGPNHQSLKLKNGASGRVVFALQSKVAVGAARVDVEVKAGELSSHESLDVPLAPSTPPSRVIKRVELTAALSAGNTVDLTSHLTGWVPGTERSTFWVTSNPYADAFSHLAYLLHYPYGCIEQTTSSTRPLLFLSSLIRHTDPALLRAHNLDDMIASGIERVFSMQTSSGGFAYWPGGTDPVDWGTAYATHMLLDAKRLKHPIAQDRLDDALGYIERELTDRLERQAALTWRDREDHGAEPYLQYVLAVAGRGRKARIEKLIDDHKAAHDGESLESLYMLKAALYLTGDRKYEADLKKPDTSAIAWDRWNGWSFYSDLRRRGMALSIFSDLFGDDPAGQTLADNVAEALRGHVSGWYNTQELVWAVTGLGKRMVGNAGTFVAPSLLANGKPVRPGALPDEKANSKTKTDTGERSFTLWRAGEYKQVALQFTAKPAGKLYLILSSDGVRADGDVPYGGEGLSVARAYLSPSGAEVKLGDGSMNLGDVAIVKLTIKNTSRGSIQNIALVDRFPAGMEVENPRLGRDAEQTKTLFQHDQPWNLEYMNIRDDRVEVFGSLRANESRIVAYSLRTVLSGKYTQLPVSAEAMYDPSIWARAAGEGATLTGPWKLALK